MIFSRFRYLLHCWLLKRGWKKLSPIICGECGYTTRSETDSHSHAWIHELGK